jgi:hypothetical protein
MNAQQPDEPKKIVRMDNPPGRIDALPYEVELWDAADGAAVERVLARASTIALARAIFNAARNERPDRRITVRRGTRILADSAG